MKKNEFLKDLEQRIASLAEADRKKSLDYYSEMIDDRIEDGITEEDTIAALGTMDEIVEQILSVTPLPSILKSRLKPNRAFKIWEIVLLIMGAPLWLPVLLSFAIVILSIYICLWAVIISLYAANLCFFAGLVAGIAGGIVLIITSSSYAQGALLVGAGLICGGLAIFMLYAFNFITKQIFKFSKFILIKIKGLFFKRSK